MAVKHRCGFCHKVLRPDGTCANEECPRYVPEENEPEQPKQEEPAEEVVEEPVGQPKQDSATDTDDGGK